MGIRRMGLLKSCSGGLDVCICAYCIAWGGLSFQSKALVDQRSLFRAERKEKQVILCTELV